MPGDVRLKEWASPPARPYRYGILLRLWDACQGFWDGRRRIPVVRTDAEYESASRNDPEARVVTPRLEYLRHLARDQIDHERSALLSRTGPLRAELAGAEERRQAAEREVRIARQRWEEVRGPVPEEDLKERRLAEFLREDRPDSLVRARRLGDQHRRLAAAGAEWAGAEERLAAAAQLVEALKQEIAGEEAAGRARARRVHELVSRRAAAYLQQLVRTHPRGPDLNARLQLLGPDLPTWAGEPSAFSGDEPGAAARERKRKGGETADGMVAP